MRTSVDGSTVMRAATWHSLRRPRSPSHSTTRSTVETGTLGLKRKQSSTMELGLEWRQFVHDCTGNCSTRGPLSESTTQVSSQS